VEPAARPNSWVSTGVTPASTQPTGFINGLGGRWRIHLFGEPKPGGAVRYNQDFGATLIAADETRINFTFFNRWDEMIDGYALTQ
jgi:hypothetical protein